MKPRLKADATRDGLTKWTRFDKTRVEISKTTYFYGEPRVGRQCERKVDPEIADAISKEYLRQKNTLELIASENIVGPAVMAAQASVMTNKYAEGYPGKRYYGGCEFVDIAETTGHRTRQRIV